MQFFSTIFIGVLLSAIQLSNAAEKYRGVAWDKKRNQWKTYVTFRDGKRKQKFGKHFYNPLDAAEEVDRVCDKLDLPRQNFDLEGNRILHKELQHLTEYIGVRWDKGRERYYASITYYDSDKKNTRLKRRGFYDDPKEAATVVDELCKLYGLERKNFDVDGKRIKYKRKYRLIADVSDKENEILVPERLSEINNFSAQKQNHNQEGQEEEKYEMFSAKRKRAAIVSSQSNLEIYDLKNEKETTTPIEINRLMQNEKENLLKRKRDMAKAVAEDHLDIVEAIYAEGWIDPNYIDDFDISLVGLDPIFNVKSWEMAQFLVNQDARTRDIVNANGETPFEAARRKGKGYEGAVKFLEQDLELSDLQQDNESTQADSLSSIWENNLWY